ncbi:MAG: hypothetical protein LBD58_11735 [Treponema sp.]|nr:hypothetical protein [Treponema sp.]
MRADGELNIAALDACRNNSFKLLYSPEGVRRNAPAIRNGLQQFLRQLVENTAGGLHRIRLRHVNARAFKAFDGEARAAFKRLADFSFTAIKTALPGDGLEDGA